MCVDSLLFGGESILGIWSNPLFRFFKIVIRHEHDVDGLISSVRPDAVVHLAALVGDPACAHDPTSARETNLAASVHLLKCARKHGVRRFVFASTCSNYGKMDDSDGFVDEESPLAPVSLYAELKVQFEEILLKKPSRSDAFCPTSLRFATVYGFSPRMRFDLTVNEFTKELVMDRTLKVYGEQFWRPYCHVGDFTRAILAVLRSRPERVAYDVFNVGSTDENYTKEMVVAAIRQVVDSGRVEYVRKVEDPRDYRVRFEKIRERLNFLPQMTVPRGVREIKEILDLGLIEDPDDSRYYNTPRDPDS